MTPEELEQIVLQQGNRLTLLDQIIRDNRLGVDTVLAFQCGHSGLYYPATYAKEWGRLFGIGLGPDVCSECLDTEYEIDPPELTPDIRSIEQIMHPVRVSKAQVDLMRLSRAEYDANKAITVADDPYMNRRAIVVRERQLVNPKGRIRNLQAAYERIGA